MRSIMRTILPLSLLLSGALTGCGATDDLSTQDQLTLAAISGEEEEVAQGDSDLAGGETNRRPLFRECDAERTLAQVMQTYDSNDDGEVAGPAEEDRLQEDQGERPGAAHRRAVRWERLAFVYDADDSGDLSDAERATLLSDFTERCEAMHARLIEEFDADGDGELSEEEREVVRETMEANRAEREAAGPEGCNRGSEMGEGGPEGRPDVGEGGPEMGGPPASAAEHSPEDRFLGEFDLNTDGELDATELSSLRDAVRERIRSGDGARPLSPPEADALD